MSFYPFDASQGSQLHIRLEIFNSVILHSFSENPNLIYAILSSHKSFEDLGTFTLLRGLCEIKHARLVKEEQARKSEGSLEPRDSGDVEKARLLSEGIVNEEDESAGQVEASVGGGNTNVAEGSTSPKSEKARGKMKERHSFSAEDVGVAAASVGRNGFVPTEEWVCLYSLLSQASLMMTTR